MLAGCGSSSATSDTVEATTASVASAEQKDARDPKQVLTDFLELKRKGNHAEADKLLSTKACEVIQRVQLSIVDMPADNSIQYAVSGVENVSAGGAHVETTWTRGSGPKAERLSLLWVMREDPVGWRIIGIIMPSVDPRSPQPTALDFEDEQQIRSFQAYMSAPQDVGAPSDQHSPPAETAAKPSPKAKETSKQ
jgi:hypothetical protein